MCKSRQQITAYAYDSKGRLLSKGRNSYTKTHPLQAYFANIVGEPHKVFLHAEVDALLRAKGKRVESLYVERVMKDGTKGNAKPCNVCMAALNAFGVVNIDWSKGGLYEQQHTTL